MQLPSRLAFGAGKPGNGHLLRKIAAVHLLNFCFDIGSSNR